MKIEINQKIINAILMIFKDFPEGPISISKVKSIKEWVDYALEWYIRNMFLNGDDYIDRQ